MGLCHVNRYAAQPGIELSIPSEASEGTVGTKQSILHHVIGVIFVAGTVRSTSCFKRGRYFKASRSNA